MAITRKEKQQHIHIPVPAQGSVEERLAALEAQVQETDQNLRQWVRDAISEMQSRVMDAMTQTSDRIISTTETAAWEAVDKTLPGAKLAELQADLQTLANDFDEFAATIKKRFNVF